MTSLLKGESACPRKLTNQDLFDRQMAMLQTFLEHGAISRAQYELSVGTLRQNMKR